MTVPDGAHQGLPATPGDAAVPRAGDRRVIGNERLTAVAGAVLLVLVKVTAWERVAEQMELLEPRPDSTEATT